MAFPSPDFNACSASKPETTPCLRRYLQEEEARAQRNCSRCQEHAYSAPERVRFPRRIDPHDPTRRNIEEGFKWLTRDIRPGDSLLFYFSGHGKRQRGFKNGEIDEFEVQTICPLDFETNGMIVDNYINQAIVRPLVEGVVLHAIIDSCHSGSVLDLPRVYDMEGGKWEDNSPPSGIYRGTKGGKAICISACEDYQMAADTSALSLDKEITGVMTTTFINAIRGSTLRNYGITYHELMESMHHQIKQAGQSGGYFAGIRRNSQPIILQDPQLSASERFYADSMFKL